MSQLPAKHESDPDDHSQTPAPRPAPAPAAPDVVALLRAFRRRWPLALGGGLLAAALVAAVAWFAVPPAKYTAVGRIRVAMVRPTIIFNLAQKDAEYAIYQRNQAAIIKGPGILGEVIRDPDVARLDTIREVTAEQVDPRDWLARNVNAEFVKGSEYLEVSMSGDRPKDVEVITNKIIDKYMKRVNEEDGGARKIRIEKLRGLWEDYQQELKTRRTTMRKLAVSAGSNDHQTLSTKGELAQVLLNQTETERMRTQHELNRVEVEIAVMEGSADTAAARPAAAAAREVPEDVLNEVLNTDPKAARLADQVARSLERYDAFRGLSRNAGDPAITKARARVEGDRKALADYREKLRPVVAKRLAGGPHPDSGLELGQLKRKAAVLKQYEKNLSGNIEKLNANIKNLNENTIDLQTEQEAIAVTAETARKVGDEVKAMDVEVEAPDRITVVERADTPRARDELKKLKVSGGAAAGAFACVLLGVTFWESRARRVNTTDEVVKGLGIRLVGSLPAPRAASRRRLAGGERPYGRHWQSMLVESVDATRTMLLHAAREDSLRVVMVTSAVAGEGKTTLSCHLTASLARAGFKTLLIDCDLRRPSAHRLFDQPSGPGVSELLRGEADLDSVIRPTQAADLDLIPAGACDAASVRAVAQGGLQAVFDELRTRYDFIIVDSAPVLPVVDSLIISQHADAVLFSILRDVSRIPSVQDARDRLSTLGVRILGAVVSGMSGQSYNARYGDIDVTADPKSAPAASARA